MHRCVWVLCLLLLSAAPRGVAARPVLADRVVAVIETGDVGARVSDIVTASEIEVAARLALVERRAGNGARVSEGLRRAVLDQLVAEVLVFREAERLALADVSPDDVRRGRDALVERLGGEEALAQFAAENHVSAAELDLLVSRRVVVQRFVQTNLRAGIEVSDEEVDREYARGTHPFVGRPLAEVREALGAWLVETRFRAALDRWVRALRGRGRVRVLESALPARAGAVA
jgi:hypothetical protein